MSGAQFFFFVDTKYESCFFYSNSTGRPIKTKSHLSISK